MNRKTLVIVTALLLSVSNLFAQNGVWQWKLDMNNYSLNPKYKHPVAYLWVPKNCREIKAVIVAQHNMEEISIMEDAGFRERLSEMGVAQVWICPRYNLGFLIKDGAWETLQETLDGLAEMSGYPELATAPVIGLGHSAAASAPYNMAVSRPDRVLACISTSGQWPYVDIPGFEMWDGKNIDFIPCLETMGEYESAVTWGDEGVKERTEHPYLPLSMLACPAEGHFAYSPEKAQYIALYIKKALQYGHVDPTRTGWLKEKWYGDKEPSCEPAPVGEYKGDPSKAFWFFDKEMVDATVAYEAKYRGLKHQLVGVKLFGEEVPQRNTHCQVHPDFRTEEDGLTIRLTPFFYDTVGSGSPRLKMWTGMEPGTPIGHASNGQPYLEMIAAPAVVTGPEEIKLCWNRMATWEENEVFIDFAIKHPGDDEYRPAVQQARITLPIRLTEGQEQKIDFGPLPDVEDGIKSIRLSATSTSGLEVGFYAESGPVWIEGNRMYFEQLPPKTKYPVKVSVVAWQYGRTGEDKIQTAEPVRQEFYIHKPDSQTSERKFRHPGITYTQADLDRMRAMIDAKQEPYYSTFLKLKESMYSDLDAEVINRGNMIPQTKHNATIGVDGRRAHDLALLWHLTGDEAYARKAVEYLNANSYYTSVSSKGTGPLDGGKIYLLVDAAELMRDYEGWKHEDQQRFKDMLVYPGYSSMFDYCARYADFHDDLKNDITFYWNIYNFDVARFGNQGLFAARGMMAMAVYLDNEKMYDRAYRYLLGLPHRPDDLPYPSGPALTEDKPFKNSGTIADYRLTGRGDIPDYGYDEQLQHYVYPNGQNQESARDQPHVMAGLHNFVAIAEIAWNQGDSLYNSLDNRLLKGLEWTYRYNLSYLRSYEDQPTPWEPSGFTRNPEEATFENGKFLQIRSRSGRWESLAVSDHGRGDGSESGGTREMALAHYAVRSGLPANDYKWLERYRDYMIDEFGCEDWGKAPKWFYEWTGWGTLTKRLTPWMAGEPSSFGADGERISGIHKLPCTIPAADYDYYPLAENPEGHTYHNVGTERGNAYRQDGAVEIWKDADDYAVVQVEDGEWMNYTVQVPESRKYSVYVEYRADGKSSVNVASDQGTETGKTKLAPSKVMNEAKAGEISLNAGACVIRLSIPKAGKGLRLYNLRLE